MSKLSQPIRLRNKTRHLLFRALFRTLPIPILTPELYDLISDLKKSRTSIDDKIEEASESLKKTSELISEIENTLGERAKKLTIIKHEIQQSSKLAEIEEEQARALVEKLQQTIDSGKNKDLWIGFGINIFAGLILFVLGIVLSPYANRLLLPNSNEPLPQKSADEL